MSALVNYGNKQRSIQRKNYVCTVTSRLRFRFFCFLRRFPINRQTDVQLWEKDKRILFHQIHTFYKICTTEINSFFFFFLTKCGLNKGLVFSPNLEATQAAEMTKKQKRQAKYKTFRHQRLMLINYFSAGLKRANLASFCLPNTLLPLSVAGLKYRSG